MSENHFDAIIVGAGPAGSVTAYLLAAAGLEVLLLERGAAAGAKNMTGGRLYSYSLARVMPDFEQTAPLQRRVARERVSMLSADSAATMEYLNSPAAEPPASDFSGAAAPGAAAPGAAAPHCEKSYTILRSEFDCWLAERAEAAGAMVAAGINVERLLQREGRVCGIIADDEEFEAAVVVLADGVNSLLAQQIGLKAAPQPGEMAVGVKELIGLPAAVIQERFGLNEREGLAWLLVGECTKGCPGGGFLYTNKDSLSLGLVCQLNGLRHSAHRVPDMMASFKHHPLIAPLVAGGKLLEYSAHLVPEGGFNALPRLYGDGVLLAGDAAGLVINTGIMIRGMDLAIASAEAAAQTIIAAHQSADFSAAALAEYQQRLQDNQVLTAMKQYRKAPAFMETPRLFKDYPVMVNDLLQDMFTVTGQNARPLGATVRRHLQSKGLLTILKDVRKGGVSL